MFLKISESDNICFTQAILLRIVFCYWRQRETESSNEK